MKNLSTIISTYEERFDEKFTKTWSGLPLSKDSFDKLKVFNRQFAADLVKEAFAATRVEELYYLPVNGCNDIVDGYNTAVARVEARQQEFINEQPQ